MHSDALITDIVQRLQGIPGLLGIVLGGSRARGTHTPTSDIDLGLYYDPAHPPDLAALRQIAQELDDAHRPDAITPLGGWGPWINGVAGSPCRAFPLTSSIVISPK
jgi:predicted nucleotidyltransferase